ARAKCRGRASRFGEPACPTDSFACPGRTTVMTTAAKAPAPRGGEQAGPWPPSAWAAPPLTTEDRLKCIEALGERIAGYVRFMSAVGTLDGSSQELKERAV